MKYFLTSLLIGLSLCADGQLSRGLVAHYSFDGCSPNDVSGNNSHGVIISPDSIEWECGVIGNAIKLNGFNESVLFLGPVNNNFDKEDFSISLYFKSTSSVGTQDLLSKREDCSPINDFAVRFTPTSNSILTELSEDETKSANVSTTLDFGKCWHHLVVVRRSATTFIYLNGELKKQASASSRVDLDNNAPLSLAGSPCGTTTDLPFSGFVDEIKIYNRALDADEVLELYIAPDQILNDDETIFLGESVQLDITSTCPTTDLEWSPDLFIDTLFAPDPVVSPQVSTTYQLSFTDDFCITTDTVRITVIDPNDLDCNQIFLPKAFTPNGDNLNDNYGISNPYAITNLLSLEIFDRWGGRVFFTNNPFETWDGSFNGKAVNPGIMLYRVKYNCDGEERIDVGSLSIIR